MPTRLIYKMGVEGWTLFLTLTLAVAGFFWITSRPQTPTMSIPPGETPQNISRDPKG